MNETIEGNVARYTRATMEALVRHGRCVLPSDAGTVSRDRTRLYHAARLAGLKISTHVNADGAVVGVVVKPEPIPANHVACADCNEDSHGSCQGGQCRCWCRDEDLRAIDDGMDCPRGCGELRYNGPCREG